MARNDSCSWRDHCCWTSQTVLTDTAVYYGLAPVYVGLGLLSHLVVLMGLYQTGKREPAYFFQVAAAANGTLEVLSVLLYCALWYWLIGFDWFVRSRLLTWLTARLANTAYTVLWMNDMLISIVMAADRLASIWAPFAYMNANRRLINWLALAGCAALSTGLNSFSSLLYTVEEQNGTFALVEDESFFNGGVFRIWALMQTGLTLVGLVTLLVLSAVLLRLNRQRRTTVERMSSVRAKAAARKRHESTLMLLTCWQCIIVTINVVAEAVYDIVYYNAESFCGASVGMLSAFVDALCMITKLLEHYVCYAVSQRFRAIVSNAFVCLGGEKRRESIIADSHTSLSTVSSRTFRN